YRRWPGEYDAPGRDLRLPGRCRLGAARRRSGAVAVHVPSAVCGGLVPAPLPEAHGSALTDADRAQVEEVVLLLHPDGGVYRVHAVPVLLDGGDRVPPGRRAVPHLAAGERDPVLDAGADARAPQGTAADHRVPAVAVEHDADRARIDRHLARL